MDKFKNDKVIYQNGRNATKILLAFLFIILLAAAIAGTYIWQHNQVSELSQQVSGLEGQLQLSDTTNTYASLKSIEIKLYTPLDNMKVSSPMAVMGQVPGSWSFEASFPVKLEDSQGNIIAQTPAQVIGDWTTDNLVPFSVQLTWSSTENGNGTLILQKDNPSGLAENDDSVSIPVKF
jgi:Immunoglobulin-like domain of bacterial spore germination.